MQTFSPIPSYNTSDEPQAVSGTNACTQPYQVEPPLDRPYNQVHLALESETKMGVDPNRRFQRLKNPKYPNSSRHPDEIEKFPSLRTLIYQKFVRSTAEKSKLFKTDIDTRPDLEERRNQIANTFSLQFLIKNLKTSDYFEVAESDEWVSLFINYLEQGNFDLLEYYLRNKHSVLPLAYHALFQGYTDKLHSINRKFLSEYLLEALSLPEAIVPFLAKEVKNQREAYICAIAQINKDTGKKELTQEADPFLIRYLSKAFPTFSAEQHQINLQQFVNTKVLSLEEGFFTIVKFSRFYQLMCVKEAIIAYIKSGGVSYTRLRLNNLLRYFEKSDTETETQEEHDFFNNLKLIYEKENISANDLNRVLVQLNILEPKLENYYSISKVNSSSFFLSLLFGEHLHWAENYDLILLPGEFSSKYADFIFKTSRASGPTFGCFPAFGIITVEDIAQATRHHRRIINHYCPTIEMQDSIHDYIDDLRVNPLHDISHFLQCRNILSQIREGLITWADLLISITGFLMSKMIFFFMDMDAPYNELWIENFSSNITGLQLFFDDLLERDPKLIKLFRPLEYQLLLTSEMFRFPEKLEIFFSAYPKENSVFAKDTLLFTLLHIFDPKFTIADFIQMKANFDDNYSSTWNVFLYLINNAVAKGKLNIQNRNILVSLASELKTVDLFKWMKNNGLKIRVSETYIRDVSDENCDVIISAWKALLPASVNLSAYEKTANSQQMPSCFFLDGDSFYFATNLKNHLEMLIYPQELDFQELNHKYGITDNTTSNETSRFFAFKVKNFQEIDVIIRMGVSDNEERLGIMLNHITFLLEQAHSLSSSLGQNQNPDLSSLSSLFDDNQNLDLSSLFTSLGQNQNPALPSLRNNLIPDGGAFLINSICEFRKLQLTPLVDDESIRFFSSVSESEEAQLTREVGDRMQFSNILPR
jgi:hypothetical protein